MWPGVIEQTANGRENYDLPSRLLKDRIILVQGEVEDSMATSIVAQLLFLEAQDPNKEISMYINSPGGSVTAGLSITDTMNFIKAPVTTIVMGLAASMGTIIAASGEKGHRYMLPNAEYLIHQPMGGAAGGTQQTDMAIIAEQLTKTRAKLNKILADASDKDLDQIAHDTERDNWMSAEETLEYGFIDGILTKSGDKPISK
ncbi:MAG: ATP-dependent Clp protease proteolytic subunit [Leuconostoc pseudomesenteroides]|jgi:ATP-dependent Clp protease protease subunit|uniref:ATP-dependent Clp protease proteolytic subunit n=1 Tax=Leuconostoc TaxID=1243 RepID=UPI0011212588|nr:MULTISPECIES: ATP-dependent Clp protease proteolytic subunit [Leuconostoc]MBK0041238.1 ATP-dependent Clp protease proteolytic subunit [Leuconostoc sp. S51]MBK0052185.1 ATP-dependent Clp protease proteolytic subunit [Leuconostoc sp. S50]MBS0957924.1 ATP-dependent Clp protease proteolytic subunit [Leuconostoc pseudomesenteroides]MCC7668549.1 ATP-dependent Clp protease proteolytic subunit [Leuconostoc pseudomesenteroides]MCT4380397.1 ATP-dependent Clp protease proteolytic subunit [Leuconostoc 